MAEDLLTQEPWIRLGGFGGVLLLMLLWEQLAPRRRPLERRVRHDLRNMAVTVIDALLVRILVPLLPIGLAIAAQERGWGLFNLVAWPGWLEVALAVILLDLAIYLQHVMFHAVPLFWRLHMVHHTDLDFGTTTGVRFHPVEILLSVVIKLGLVLVLGPAPLAVLLFEVLLNATSMFNHGNVRIPARVDRWLRWIVVTPDMHRVHHSAEQPETDSNFGFNLPWWDRLLGTYRAAPAAGHEGMTIGLKPYRRVQDVSLVKILLLPFGKLAGGGREEVEESPEEAPAPRDGGVS